MGFETINNSLIEEAAIPTCCVVKAHLKRGGKGVYCDNPRECTVKVCYFRDIRKNEED